jgi:hypothetical protein
MSEVSEISIHSNFLTVDGKELRAEVLPIDSSDKLIVSAEELSELLTYRLNRVAVCSFIEDQYRRQLKAKPTQPISRPSVLSVQFGTTAETQGRTTSKVLTEKGWLKNTLYTEADDVRVPFRDYLNATFYAGFVPELNKLHDGSWLAVRRPTLPEVNERWLEYEEDDEMQKKKIEVIEHHLSTPWNRELSQQAIRSYRFAGEVAIDRYSDSYGDTMRPNQHVGSILAVAALKNFVGDLEGYRAEVDDAITYAERSDFIHSSSFRAILNSVHGTSGQ